MKRKSILTLLFALMMVVLSACSCGGPTTTSPTPMPTSSIVTTPMPSPSLSPEMSPSMLPDTSASPLPSAGAAMVDTTTLVMEVEKLSEIKKATVAISDGKALVGITFDDQYQGTLTQRIDEMIAEKLKATDATLTEVMVTADPTLVTEIDQIATKIRGMTEITQTERDTFDALVKKITPVT